MKEMRKDDKPISMTCEGCVFAEYEDTTQYGCSADRIRKFSDQDTLTLLPGDNGITVFGINRFCNLYRDKEWLDKQEDIEPELFIDDDALSQENGEIY